jgi:MFS family permease
MRFGWKTPDLNSNGNLNVFVLCSTICLMQTGIYSWYKILPNYLAEKGASAEQIGLAFTLITVAYRAPQVIGGFLSDRLGAHVTTIYGTLLMGLGLIALSWCENWNTLLIGLCSLFGFGALMYPGQLTLLAHSASTESKAQAIGLFDGCNILGYLLGPLLGAIILALSPSNSLQILLILNGLIYLVMGMIRYRYLSAAPASFENESVLVSPDSGPQWVMGGLTLLLSMAGFLVYFLLWDGPFSAMYLNDVYKLSKPGINLHSSLSCFFAIISALLFSRLVDRIGAARFLMVMFLMIAGIASLFVVPWFFGAQTPMMVPMAPRFPYGLGYLTTAFMIIPVEGYFIAYQKMVTSLGSKKNRAFWVGFFGSLMGLVPAVGIHWGGVLYSHWGMVGPMILALGGSILGAFLAYGIVRFSSGRAR